MKRTILLSLLATVFIIACKNDADDFTTPSNSSQTTGSTTGGIPEKTCDSNVVYFEKDILPILTSNCAYSGCHDPGTASDGIILNSYDNVIRTGGIISGSAHNSEIYEKITETDPEDRMPPAPKPHLSSVQIALIGKWINQGAKNITCNSMGCDTVNVTYTNQVSQIINTYCKGCHSGSNPGGSVLLTDYTNVKNAIQNGKLLCAVEQMPGCSPMPKGGNKLDACKIVALKKWQAAGFAQ